MRGISLCRGLFVLFALTISLLAGPRARDWENVAAARKKDQPQTAITALRTIETAAFADHAWAEGVRAMALRIFLTPGNEKSPTADAIRQLDAATAAAPPEARPILETLAACWMAMFYEFAGWDLRNRSPTTEADDAKYETWDAARILTEIDRRFQTALAHRDILRNIPVRDFGELLKPGELDDSLRPTLYDFAAHAALEFYAKEIVAAKYVDDFQLKPDSPALDDAKSFLAWQPESNGRPSPQLRSLKIYQDLLAFHQTDPDRSAFLHCDLERLRWAGKRAVGEIKLARLEAALRAFVAANAKHPLSADARQDLAAVLMETGHNLEAHDIAKAGAAAFPDHPFGKLCATLTKSIERPDFDIQMRSTLTPAGEDIMVDHRNLNHIWFRAYQIKWQVDSEMVGWDVIPDYDGWARNYSNKKPTLAWDAPLPDDKDFAEHLTRVPAPKNLPPGFYIILASGRPQFSIKDNLVHTTAVHVTNYAMAVWQSGNGSNDGIVTDAVTGAPVANMKVMKYWVPEDKKGNQLNIVKSQVTHTGADGFFSFPCPSVTYHSILLVASSGNDRVVARTNDGDCKEASMPPESRVTVFTDRAIYRPGQTIQFKGIIYFADQAKGIYQTVAGKHVTAQFQAGNGKVIDSLELFSNDRGSFVGSFTAPSGNLLGRMSIDCGKLGGTEVQVEEYKRPKFFASIMPPEAPAVLGNRVDVKGKAEAYTGAAVDGAKVEWQVVRHTTVPEWAFWLDFAMKSPGPDQEIASGSSISDANGSFTISFIAAPDPTVNPAAAPDSTFDITADITEQSGETRSVRESIAVGFTSLRAAITTDQMPEAGKQCRFKIRTETHDGNGRPAKGVLKIHKIAEPETCPRNDDGINWPVATEGKQADPTDTHRWPNGDIIAEIPIQTAANGESEITQALPEGLFRLMFETTDSNDHPVKTLLEVQVLTPDGTKFPTKIPFFADSPEWKVEPGKTFTLYWGSGHPAARACIEWRQGTRLLKREWSAPGRTQQSFSWPVDESLRGGFSVTVVQTTMNRLHTFSQSIEVPWSNKDLKLRWEHLTSKLEPGAKDTWTAVITGPDNKPADAELVATLYDASLDAILGHEFPDFTWLFPTDCIPNFNYAFSHSYGYPNGWMEESDRDWVRIDDPYRYFVDRLDYGSAHDSMVHAPDVSLLFNRGFEGPELCCSVGTGHDDSDYPPSAGTGGFHSGDAVVKREDSGPQLPQSVGYAPEKIYNQTLTAVPARKNLQETAFFYPQLTTDAEGRVRISFNMPEALTTWRFLGFAHDKDLRSGLLEGKTVTSKDLMVQPNPPRFLREGDVLDFAVKITNRSGQAQSGMARLTLTDAASGADRTAALGIKTADQEFNVPAGESRTFSWRLTVPDGTGFLTYKAVAASGNLSDGEEGWLPVLPRRELVTESMALTLREPGTKSFTFAKLKDSGNSPTLRHQFVHVQAVANPVWYAVLALPYLMEYPHECAEQTFHRYYANALASRIAQADPEIRRVFDQWRNTPALDSPLDKNPDLKGIMLEETPWLREAHDESQARRNLGILLDINRTANETERCLSQLREMQLRDGLWPWFQGGEGNETISLGIVAGFARLRELGVPTDITPALKCLTALDHGLTEKHAVILRDAAKDPAVLAENHLDPEVAYYLYARTFFLKDKALSNDDQAAFAFFTQQAKNHWTKLTNRMSRAHAALALSRLGDKETAGLITRSLKEHANVDADHGMRWSDEDGWWWWQAPIETQAMMIEAFSQIDHDAKAVEDCQTWLIQQKQVQNWHSTTATADAVASLLTGVSDNNTQTISNKQLSLLTGNHSVEITMGGEKLQPPQMEAGTGFYEMRIAGPAVKPALGDLSLTKTGTGVSWASVHWQYLEDIAKITGHHTNGLSIEKSLFVRRTTAQGKVLEPLAGKLKVGDELVTRLVIRNEQAMEFLHVKDGRGSGTEPLNVLSGYRWQDGISYYETTRDTATHFFIDHLPAGTHVLETAVRIQQAGIYQTGTAEIKCLYAPEFGAHSGSVAIEVAPNPSS